MHHVDTWSFWVCAQIPCHRLGTSPGVAKRFRHLAQDWLCFHTPLGKTTWAQQRKLNSCVGLFRHGFPHEKETTVQQHAQKASLHGIASETGRTQSRQIQRMLTDGLMRRVRLRNDLQNSPGHPQSTTPNLLPQPPHDVQGSAASGP